MRENYDYRDTYKTRIIAAALIFIAFLIEYWLMSTGRLAEADEAIGEWARNFRGPVTNVIFIAITNMARWTTIVGIGVVLLVIDLIRWRKPDVPVAITGCLINLGIYAMLKSLIQRQRPDKALWLVLEHGFSYPSGHTMNGMFCYGMMLYLILRNSRNEVIRKTACIVEPVLVILIGFSRLFCGVHYFSDVLGASLIGLSLLLLFTVGSDEVLRLLYKV